MSACSNCEGTFRETHLYCLPRFPRDVVWTLCPPCAWELEAEPVESQEVDA